MENLAWCAIVNQNYDKKVKIMEKELNIEIRVDIYLISLTF